MLQRYPKRSQPTRLDTAASGLLTVGFVILVIGLIGGAIKVLLGLLLPALIVGGFFGIVFIIATIITRTPSIDPHAEIVKPRRRAK